MSDTKFQLIGEQDKPMIEVISPNPDFPPVITVEDHSVTGGFGSGVLETAQEMGLSTPLITRLGMPANDFVPHGSRAGQLARCGIDAAGIAAAVRNVLGAKGERRAEAPRSARRSVLSRR